MHFQIFIREKLGKEINSQYKFFLYSIATIPREWTKLKSNQHVHKLSTVHELQISSMFLHEYFYDANRFKAFIASLFQRFLCKICV